MKLMHSGRAYSRLVEELLAQVDGGELVAGDRIPTETELGAQYGISITSVRRGLRLLEERGMLVRQQGSGSYVSEPVQASRPRVERTTVATLWPTSLKTYHPYFSEMRGAVDDSLARHGWSTWTPQVLAERSTNDLTWNSLGQASFRHELQQHPELAGAIMGGAIARDLLASHDPGFPVVVDMVNDRFPYVVYDWNDEVEQGLRHLLRHGCRRLAVLSQRTSKPVQALVQRAAAATDTGDAIDVQELPKLKGGNVLSHWIRESYAGMHRFLAEGAVFDGVLIDDDFCTQGALDALVEHGPANAAELPIVSLTNSKSQIHTPLPYTAVVADGSEHGQALVDLLVQHMSQPAQAPSSVILRGDIRRAPGRPH